MAQPWAVDLRKGKAQGIPAVQGWLAWSLHDAPLSRIEAWPGLWAPERMVQTRLGEIGARRGSREESVLSTISQNIHRIKALWGRGDASSTTIPKICRS